MFSCLSLFNIVVVFFISRFEGNHALPKKLSATTGCFKNLPVTYADIHQTNQCAEFLDLKVGVREEVDVSWTGRFIAAGNSPYFDTLSPQGILREDALKEVKQAKISGFLYQEGLYLNLKLQDDVPIFGLIRSIFMHAEQVFMVSEDCRGVYDDRLGAFRIEKETNSTFRWLTADKLSSDRPMSPWTIDYLTFYVSPRRTLS